MNNSIYLSLLQTDWKSAFNAIETTLALEKDVNKSLLNLASVAVNNQDKQLLHTLKQVYFICWQFFLLILVNRKGHLNNRVKTIYNIVRGFTQLQRVGGEGLGLHLLDQDLYKYEHFL